MLNRTKIITLLGMAVVSTLLSGVANADSLRSVSIKSVDLDLTSDAGRTALQDRVQTEPRAMTRTDDVPDWSNWSVTDLVETDALRVTLGAFGVVVVCVERFTDDRSHHAAVRRQLRSVDEARRIPQMRSQERLRALRVRAPPCAAHLH